jgi:hypothetical protein
MTAKEWIERLHSLDPEETICIHLWQVDDVLEKAQEMDKAITHKEAQEILF